MKKYFPSALLVPTVFLLFHNKIIMFLRCYVNQQLIKVINISTKYAVDNLAKHGRDSGNSGFLGGLIVDNRSNFCGKLFEKLITLYYWIGLCRLKCFTLCADFIYVSDGLRKLLKKFS